MAEDVASAVGGPERGTAADPGTAAVTMYTTSWCGYCRRLKAAMTREGIGYREVNIEEDPGAADFVMSVNGGNQTVPTVVFADGTALTNPSLPEVKATLARLAA
jgi:mycoredoxin